MFTRTPARTPAVRRLTTALTLTIAAGLPVPALAGANTITSDNWSGYAAHRSGVQFRRVSATWREPAAICSSGESTYSAFWVGIGGYSLSSEAMEQVGSELDCNADGTQSLSAWYELVPAPSRTLTMTIASGDLISGTIVVAGRRVRLTLTDHTRGESFVKTIVDHSLDTTSAEWIAEAPSTCTKAGKCTTLPLADFGGVDFSHAEAQTSTGRTAAISSSLWSTTELLLGYTSRDAAFVADNGSAQGTPTALDEGGEAFRVNYSGTGTTTTGTGGSSESTESTGSGGTSGTGGDGGTGPGEPGGFGGAGPGGRVGGPGGGDRPFAVRSR